MRITEYTPPHFGALQQLVQRIEEHGERRCCSLAHRRFVDYYYATRESCHLYLLLGDNQELQAVLGVEQMPFEAGPGGKQKLTLGFGTNFYSLLPGAGGYLFLHWLRTAPVGLAFGASSDGLRMLRSHKWTQFSGSRTVHLN